MIFKANIELSGQLNTIEFDKPDRESVIKEIWDTYGIATMIIDITEVTPDGTDN